MWLTIFFSDFWNQTGWFIIVLITASVATYTEVFCFRSTDNLFIPVINLLVIAACLQVLDAPMVPSKRFRKFNV